MGHPSVLAHRARKCSRREGARLDAQGAGGEIARAGEG
jgi:hypothetical protein